MTGINMDAKHVCVGGDGGPLVVLQGSATSQWQGASDFDNSLMGGGDTETDYDIACGTGGIVTRYDREILVLWDSEFGASFLPPEPLSLPLDALVISLCFHFADFAEILPAIVERLRAGEPEHSSLFNIQDTTLRLQVAADNAEPDYIYTFIDVAVSPGQRQCDVYHVKHHSLVSEVIVMRRVET